MNSLIKIWEIRAKKYKSLAAKSLDELTVQGLLSYAEAYQICADELKETIKFKGLKP